MATSHKVTDKFLTCTVCMEVFTDPCTLECQHSFCRKCLVSFTKTQPDAIQGKTIPCPSCRKFTKVPNPDRPVDEWARQIKLSFVVQGLVDSFGPGTKDTKHCRLCKEEGETIAATVWCSDCDDALCDRCARLHKRMRSSQNHDVIGLTEDVQIKRKRKVMCKEHPEEKVEFLCKDCKKAVYHKCCTLYHRRCETVVTLESEMITMKSALAKGRETLIAKASTLKLDVATAKSKETKVTTIYQQNQSEIKAEFQKAREVINQKEKKLLTELKGTTDKQLGYLKADIKTKDMAIYMYEQQAELIDHIVTSDCEMDVYEMYLSYESGNLEPTENTTRDQKGEKLIDQISYKDATGGLTKALDGLDLGCIYVQYEERFDMNATPLLQDTIETRVPSDKKTAYPFDVTVLYVNGTATVVVTDRYNRCVKSFYDRNNEKCHSKLCLDQPPWGLTQLKHNQVAATVPSAKQILIVDVAPEMKLSSTIATMKSYYGITTLTPSTVALCCKLPPSVDIMDMSGNVIRSMTPSIAHPEFLSTTDKGNIIVSSYGTKSVVGLTQEGNVVFNSSTPSLRGPQGITTTTSGDILVADLTSKSIVHLTRSGQFVRNILTSQEYMENSRGLSYDKNGHLYICLSRTGTVKVFAFRGEK